MKKKSRIEIETKIVARVKREMDQPRLTASVRDAFSAQPHRQAKGPPPVLAEQEPPDAIPICSVPPMPGALSGFRSSLLSGRRRRSVGWKPG